MINHHHLEALKVLAGNTGWSEDAGEIAPHLADWRGRYKGKTPLLLKPDTTKALSEIIRYCSENKIAVVPQGGNTGLVKGGVPSEIGNEILISTKRLIGDIKQDSENNTITAPAGVPVQLLHDAAKGADRTLVYP